MLAAHGTPDTIISAEPHQMRDHRLAKTANRSVVGIMNESTHLAETDRELDALTRSITPPAN